ncbi:Phosphotyrosyl phosphate activator protein-domain-containing protein [Emericellopsis atlantica]|uniref:Serine/threonine-protein phosphatase 2A activator n=1 Tax=Emericellopsis atlantica TaxID=2614577 RepID=A0A9P8CTG5_9HYPO|nr:Phosphotyrosyl phosphate activator protein-domain-containing protein [Emericellopsis atlantica]KAG9256801.1 Phosphotyrosyl phosphate activator protein-domain-containing protein [Emericellopsis atlantica]
MASASSTAGPKALPKLPRLDLTAPHTFTTPVKRIHEGTDVSQFLTSLAYRDIGIFILQLNHALVPRQDENGKIRTFSLPNAPSSTPSIKALQELLETVETYIDEAPPDPGPRRFGNVSFRKWHELLDNRMEGLLGSGLLADTLKAGHGTAKQEVASYFKGAWGSSQRLDYGTGHELSFLAFLGCLWKLGYFNDGDSQEDGALEREIVLSVIEPYLSVVRKLILTYTLEPAGSHGVWGLDDHSFLPYIFGSAQLARPISSPSEPTPLEGSVRGAPRPSAVTAPQQVEDYRKSNMYFAAVGFINDVKKGPFWEHSPILFDISGIKDGWGKINKGMVKMFNAEVLSKFPVVQHFPFGSLFSWEQDPTAPTPTQSVHMANQPIAAAAASSSGTGTGAPWAQATRMPAATGPGVPYSRVPAGPSSGSLGARPQPRDNRSQGETSTEPQISMTKAPWAK